MQWEKASFNEQEEKELEAVVKDLAQRGFPLTENNIRDLAHQYVTKMALKGCHQRMVRQGAIG